uniref:CCHC-type domain-containing protein n=1 Tax=Tanacetum cinerariifolium TaxID=118510 RepID=A0A6L2JB50_TANCI|nr:hypothetical protein VITISV_013138 [Tanacetum cinerariifolium]
MHTSEDFTLDQIQKHLRIEEETRILEKNLNGASSSKVNFVDSGKNNKGNNKKRKGIWNSSKDNKKDKKPLSDVVCYKCGEKGHIKRYCKNPKKKIQNSNKKDKSSNAVEQVDTTIITAMVSELYIGMIQELHMASVTTTDDWWYDYGATTHVCNNRDLFKTYKETKDGHEVMMVIIILQRTMKDMLKQSIISYNGEHKDKCEICVQAKMKRKPFPKVDRQSEMLELVHSDICELDGQLTRGGNSINEIVTQIPQDISGLNLNSFNKRNMAESSSAPRRSERARKERNLDPDFINSRAIIFLVQGINETKKFLSSCFQMKDMNEVDTILEIKVKKHSGGYALTQCHYIDKIIDKFQHLNIEEANTPYESSCKLVENNGRAVAQIEYASAIGCLISDSKSTTGWIFTLGGGAVCWGSKKQTCITHFTMEDEFLALAAAGKGFTYVDIRSGAAPTKAKQSWVKKMSYLLQIIIDHDREKTLDGIIDPDLWKQIETRSLNILVETAYDCLNEEQSQRPNIDEIVTRLKKALELQLERKNVKALELQLATGPQDAFANVATLSHRIDIVAIGLNHNGISKIRFVNHSASLPAVAKATNSDSIVEPVMQTRSTETSNRLAAIQAQLNNLRREIKKVNEKVYDALVGYELCKGPHYTKDCPLKEEGKTLEEAYYTQFGVPFQQGEQYRGIVPRLYQKNNINSSCQEQRQSMEESLSKFMNELEKRLEENFNMIKEIQSSTDTTIRNQETSIKTLEIQIGKMSKVQQKRGFGSLPSCIETNLWDHVKSISTTIETDTTMIRHIGSTRYVVSDPQNSKLFFVQRQTTIPFLSRLNDCCCDEKKGLYEMQYFDAYSNRATVLSDYLPRKEKDPRSFTLPCYINNVCFKKSLANLEASVSVMPLLTYINPCLGELTHTKLIVELVDRKVKHPKGIAKNVLVGICKFVFPVDFIILDMLEDINVSLILERPFLSTAHAKVDLFKINITLRVRDENIIFKSIKPASSLIKKLRRNRVDDLEPIVEEGEVVNEPMTNIVKARCDFISGLDDYPSNCDFDRKIHIDCAYNLTFSCMIVVEDMDPYLDEGIGDVIVEEPFCKASCMEAIMFDGIITICDGDDSLLDSKGAIPTKTLADAKDCPLNKEGKTLEESYYTQFEAPYQPRGQYRAARPEFYQRNNGNSSYPDRRQTLEESLTKFMAGLAKRHKENSNIIKEIQASIDAAIGNQRASIKTLEIQIGQMNKVLQEKGIKSFPGSTEPNPKDHVKSISTAKANSFVIRHIGLGPYTVSDT